MKCADCPYYWKNEDDFFAHCQYDDQMDCPPCEYEEPEEVNWEDYM